MKLIRLFPMLTGTLALAVACSQSDSPPITEDGAQADTQQTLTIYSARHYDSDRLLYDAFAESAGVKVDVREAKAEQLLETLKAEGENSPADIVISADAGSLWRFQSAGLTQSISDDRLISAAPEEAHQRDGHWYGVARRLRGIVYDPDIWIASDVDEWTDLTAADKSGEICVRSSSNIYNLSLLAEMIHRTGSDRAQDWANSVSENMARRPQGGDTDQIRAVAAGECSIAIVNHYYWVRLGASETEADQTVAAKTQFIIPSFADDLGAHVNITGAGVLATADDADLATDFIAFLLTPEGQTYLTMETKELPILDGADLPDGVDVLPAFTASATPLDVLGENQAEAQRLYDLAGWN